MGIFVSNIWQKDGNFPRVCYMQHACWFFFFFLIYLFLAVLGLRCCAQAFSSCGERGPLFPAVHEPLNAVASPVVEHGV